jgi:hypothetical protein
MERALRTTESCFSRAKRELVRIAIVLLGMPTAPLWCQTAFTWQQIKDKFEAANPTLKAAHLNIDESRAAEVTAYLRPNPEFSLTADGVQRCCGNTRRQLSARTAA